MLARRLVPVRRRMISHENCAADPSLSSPTAITFAGGRPVCSGDRVTTADATRRERLPRPLPEVLLELKLLLRLLLLLLLLRLRLLALEDRV